MLNIQQDLHLFLFHLQRTGLTEWVSKINPVYNSVSAIPSKLLPVYFPPCILSLFLAYLKCYSLNLPIHLLFSFQGILDMC